MSRPFMRIKYTDDPLHDYIIEGSYVSAYLTRVSNGVVLHLEFKIHGRNQCVNIKFPSTDEGYNVTITNYANDQQ